MRIAALTWVGLLYIPFVISSASCCGDDDDSSSSGSAAETGGSGAMGSGGGTSAAATGGAAPNGTGGSGATGGGGARYEPPGSSLPQDAALSSLSAAQADQLCQQSGTFFIGLVQTESCMMVAWYVATTSGNADTQASCQASYDACMLTPEQSDRDCEAASDAMARCSATVGEFTQCFVDLGDAVDARMASMTCANVSRDEPPGIADPTSCTDLQAECPGAAFDVAN